MPFQDYVGYLIPHSLLTARQVRRLAIEIGLADSCCSGTARMRWAALGDESSGTAAAQPSKHQAGPGRKQVGGFRTQGVPFLGFL